VPHDYDDDDTTGFGLGEHIDSASSVNASGGGYSIPSTPFIIAPYRSLAVFVKPSGSIAATVSVTWDYDGLAGGATATETKIGTLLEGETFIFRNHGVQVTDVTIVADNSTAYVVSPSNVDPLPEASDTALPFLILTGQTKNVPGTPSGDSDHGKFKATPVWTNALSEWSFTLDSGGFIKQIDVAGPGLYELKCAFEWASSGVTVRKSVAINASGNVNQTYNDPNFFGVSPYWETDSLVFEAAMIAGICPINASGGFFTVEPDTNIAAGINFRPNYLFIVKHPLTS